MLSLVVALSTLAALVKTRALLIVLLLIARILLITLGFALRFTLRVVAPTAATALIRLARPVVLTLLLILTRTSVVETRALLIA